MSTVGLIGILLCLVALPVFRPRSSAGLLLFFMLLALHVAASVAFHQYALTTPADAALYYLDTTGLRRAEFTLGTIFTIKLVQFLKAWIGGTYLDYFLLFQAVGFWGILLLQRCIEHAEQAFGNGLTRAPFWVLFLPGLHFWTGAIGKDAPLFFAISLAVYATVRLSTRALWFGTALFIMVLFRPHIALLAAAALACASFFGSETRPLQKIMLVLVALIAIGSVAGSVESSFSLDLSNPASIGAYLEKQQANLQGTSGAADFQNAFFGLRLVSLLFRPFFFDAQGLFAFISSVENLAYLFIVGFMVRAWKDGVLIFRAAVFFRFAFFFAVALTVLLTMVYYNVGLGLRQKTMVMPALLTFFGGQWMMRGTRLRAAVQSSYPYVPTLHREPSATIPSSDGDEAASNRGASETLLAETGNASEKL